ncbi:MAG: nitroreductase family protein [candidate division WOR-3 bacterium]
MVVSKRRLRVAIVLLFAAFLLAFGSGAGYRSLARGNIFRSESLPAPTINSHSFELLANSRYSVHSGFEGELPVEVMANVLWAMSQVPYWGNYREFYVATPENVYRYNPMDRTLTVHLAGDRRYNSGSAFEVGIATPRHEYAGMAIQAGLLAGRAFSDFSGGNVVSCPMKWATDYANSNWQPEHPIMMVNVFGNAPANPLDTTLVAISSDTSLPAPYTTGADTFELLLMELRQDSTFSSIGLSLETMSQLLWAGYGVTPHSTTNGRQGLTVPSAIAGYFLTGKIYLVHEEGVDRYHNRLPPGNNLTTKDHRLERVISGDRRQDLRQASNRIPSNAPVYIVVCAGDTSSYQTMEEAGFVAFNLLIQAQALGLGGFLTMPLTREERTAIQNALFLPANQYPILIFSVGEVTTGIRERRREGVIKIVRAQTTVRKGNLRVEYLLRRAGIVRAEVFDLLGRPVKTIFEASQPPGYHSVLWDGTNDAGAVVRRGSYVITLSCGGTLAQHKVTWAR